MGILLSALMLFGAAYVGMVGSSQSLDLGENVMSISGSLSDAEMAQAGLPSAGRLRFGGILSILAALSAATLLVVTFVHMERVPVVAIATLMLFVLALFFYPTFENGPPADLTPRMQALIAAGLAFGGAIGSFLVKREYDRSDELAS